MYMYLSVTLVLIMKFYTVPVCLHTVKNLLSSKHMSIFFCYENMKSFLDYNTSMLRALFA